MRVSFHSFINKLFITIFVSFAVTWRIVIHGDDKNHDDQKGSKQILHHTFWGIFVWFYKVLPTKNKVYVFKGAGKHLKIMDCSFETISLEGF